MTRFDDEVTRAQSRFAARVEQLRDYAERLNGEVEALFVQRPMAGIGTFTSGQPQTTFAELWWPGYVRQPVAARMVWQLPGNFSTLEEFVIGQTRRDRNGMLLVRCNCLARFDRNGKIIGLGPFPEDRWLGPNDELIVDHLAAANDPPRA